MRIYITLLLVMLITFSCSKDYTPKPRGYNRIDKPVYNYNRMETPFFELEYPDFANIEIVEKNETKNNYWFNFIYPNYKASVYCTYLPINKQTLQKAIEDSHHLAFSHSIKADGIKQTPYLSDSTKTINALVFEIDGQVATPLQFYITDNEKNFLRGSVYFDNKVNADSVAPIVEYIKGDIKRMIVSIRWMK